MCVTITTDTVINKKHIILFTAEHIQSPVNYVNNSTNNFIPFHYPNQKHSSHPEITAYRNKDTHNNHK